MNRHHQFASFLRKRRAVLNLTGPQLADSLGVSKSNVSYWESGEFLPKPELLRPLARVLRVSYEDVYAAAHKPGELPAPALYLRAKYRGLPERALEEAEQFFTEFEQRYGGSGDAESDQ
jgi:transcriptional regulator with XRE-family HTH domain